MDILQVIQMDQSYPYASQVSNGGGGISGGRHMHPQNRGDWQRGWKWWGTLASAYWTRSVVWGQCVYMISRDFPNRGGSVLFRWWIPTLLVVAHSSAAEAETKMKVGTNCEDV